MKVLLFVCCFLVFGVTYADPACEADLNGDGICDPYSISTFNPEDGLSKVTITIGGTEEKREGKFELGNGGLTVGYLSGDFSLSLDFYTSSINLTRYDFRWRSESQDWVLYKKSSWVEQNRDEKYSIDGEPVPNESRIPTKFDVRRIECCTLFSQFSKDNVSIKYLGDDQSLVEIKKDLKYIINNIHQGESGQLFYKVENGVKVGRAIPADFIYEITKIIDDDNVGYINDYAYYLYLNKKPILAAIILRVVHAKYPDRVVATLNLADAYWDIGMKSDACLLYQDYSLRMVEKNKSSKIPAKVQPRTKCQK